jgi:hypothetical protein
LTQILTKIGNIYFTVTRKFFKNIPKTASDNNTAFRELMDMRKHVLPNKVCMSGDEKHIGIIPSQRNKDDKVSL